jgi:hypothetical protein
MGGECCCYVRLPLSCCEDEEIVSKRRYESTALRGFAFQELVSMV